MIQLDPSYNYIVGWIVLGLIVFILGMIFAERERKNNDKS